MGIKISKQDGMYSAEVTPPHGQWRSPHPMIKVELEAALKSIGCDQRTISSAFYEEFSQQYRPWAEEAVPLVKTALDGSREVSPQSPFVEAWLTYALFMGNTELTIQELIETADSINHSIPSPDEVSWAFLQLRKRGWLVEHEEAYGLTAEGRHSVEEVVSSGELLEELDMLQEWTSLHPPLDG